MAVLVLGLILFLFPHMLRELGLREALAGSFPSPGAYKGAYSLTALLGLALIVWGKSIAPFVMVWEPPFGLRNISYYLMFPVFWLLLASFLPMSGIRRSARNPMVLGVTLWGAAHLWTNGDLASMLLFGGFTLWGAVKFVTLWGRTAVSEYKFRIVIWDIVSGVLGMTVYWAVFVFHGDLFGVGLVL